MLHKKGVSPLIATVLLIAFAVALGAIVMNWGRGYVTATTEAATETSSAELACGSNVDVGIVSIAGVRQICYNSTANNVEFILENRKNTKVYDIRCQIMGTASKIPVTVTALNVSGQEAGLKESGSDLLHCDIDPSIGSPKNVRLIPSLSVGGKIQQCHVASFDVDDILPCEQILG